MKSAKKIISNNPEDEFSDESSSENEQTKELDYDINEEIRFENDVYKLTICAILSKSCSPLILSFAIKQCLILFSI